MIETNINVPNDAPCVVAEQGFGRDIMLLNRDTATTIYLGTARNVLPTNGLPLRPGSTKVWLAGDPCYAITDAATKPQLHVSQNTGMLFDPQTIAQQLKISGVPAIDARVTLEPLNSRSIGVTSGVVFPTEINFNATYDVSAYSTLNMLASTTGAGVPAATDSTQVSIRWYADSAGTILIDLDVLTYNNVGTSISLSIPTRAPYASISVFNTSTTRATTWAFQLLASYRSIAGIRNRRVRPTALNTFTPVLADDGGLWSASNNVAAGGTVVAFPMLYSGRCHVYFRCSNAMAAATSELKIMDQNTNERVEAFQIPISTIPASYRFDFISPNRDWRLELTNNEAVARTFIASLGFEQAINN